MAQVENVSGQPRDLADGRVLAPGAKATNVDVFDLHNEALIEAGFLSVLERKPAAAKKRRTATPDKED